MVSGSMRSSRRFHALALAVTLGCAGLLLMIGYERGMIRQPALQASTSVTLRPSVAAQTNGPLRVLAANPRYFTDGSGKAVYLTGAHTWGNGQAAGYVEPPAPFDYASYLDYLQGNGHNFIRLWVWEQAKWGGGNPGDFWIAPQPYLRTGPGTAADGKAKFDLTQFDEQFFTLLRQHVEAAGARGMYVSVMLFNGWSIETKGDASHIPWRGHPLNAQNNVNGINGDPNGDGEGLETHTLDVPAITALQEAYVRKVIDTVGDLDNVLYEVSNESHSNATAWQYHMVDFIKAYELTRPKQHPVGMTVEYPNGSNAELYAGNADWISPNGSLDNPPAADGRKVVLLDTDHLCGICGDRTWVWKSFTRGYNVLLMDPYTGENWGLPPGYDPNAPQWVSMRANMGYARDYAQRMNLAAMTPRGDLCSTGYCLANPTEPGAEYLVYAPSGGSLTVNLTGASGKLDVEWLNPATGTRTSGPAVTGGTTVSFVSPFGNNKDAVLFLQQHTMLPTPTPTRSLTTTPQSTKTPQPTTTPQATLTLPSITPKAHIYLPAVVGSKLGATVLPVQP